METLCTVIVAAAVLGPLVLLVVRRGGQASDHEPDAVRVRAELAAIAARRDHEEPSGGSTAGPDRRSVGIRTPLVGRASGSAS